MNTDRLLADSLELLARGHRLYGRADPQPITGPADAEAPRPGLTARSRRLAADLHATRSTDAQLVRLIGAARADHATGRSASGAVLADARADRTAADTALGRREAARRMAARLRRQRARLAASHGHARRLAHRLGALNYRPTVTAGDVGPRIAAALDQLGIHDRQARRHWIRGYRTLIARESGGRAGAVAARSATAPGPIQPDGHRRGFARGLTQTLPATFARYHQPGTSTDIYDPVANICASMNYVMQRYGVHPDGSNLADLVQQADPQRAPKGY